MKISVVIPTRNRYDYVKLLVNDLQSQTLSDFETIVVDQSKEQQNLSYCKHIFIKSTGPCVSRNIGAAEAKGDILVFLDDDARVNSDFVEEITKPILNDKYDAVAGAVCDLEGNYLLEDEQFLKISNINFIKVITSNPNAPQSRASICMPAGCSAIKTSVFNSIGGFDESFDPTGAGEDREMSLRLFKKGFSVWYNAKAKLLHARAPEGGSRDVGSRTLMLDVHTYRMCKKHFSDELAQVLKQTIIQSYRKRLIASIFSMKLTRTRYLLLKRAKHLMK